MQSFIDYLSEDVDTDDYKIKTWVDRNGKTRKMKIHSHRVDFKNSKSGGEPSQDDESSK